MLKAIYVGFGGDVYEVEPSPIQLALWEIAHLACELKEAKAERKAALPPNEQEQRVISMTQTDDVFHRAECLDELESFWWDLRYRNVDLALENEGQGERIRELENALSRLVDAEECAYDHHGYCQTHNFLQNGVCPNRQAKRLLYEVKNSDEQAVF